MKTKVPSTSAFKVLAKHLSSKGFSLVEMLLVISIMAIIFAFAMPSLSLLGTNSLSSGGSQFASYLVAGRAKAISEGQAVRIVLPKSWVSDPSLAYRKAGILRWSNLSLKYFPSEAWSVLPPGIIWEDKFPEYIKDANYAKEDPDTTIGIVPPEEFSIIDEAEKVLGEGIYFDFLPNGSVRSSSQKPILSIVLVQGSRELGEDPQIIYEGTRDSKGAPKNWVQINVHCLTGKVELLRP